MALLTDGSFLDAENSSSDPTVDIVTTRSGNVSTIDGADGMPSGTHTLIDESYLTEPSAGYPLGLVVLVLAVRFPADGINPAYTRGYYSVFDASTEQRLSTSAPFDESQVYNSEFLGFDNGDIRLAYNDFITVDAAGNITHTPFPGGGSGETATGSFVESPPVDGRILVEGYADAEGECPTVWAVDVATLQTLSSTGCLHDTNDRNFGDWYFDGSVYGVPAHAAFVSATTGADITTAGELGPDGSGAFTQGVRSDVALFQNGKSYFVSTSTWNPVFIAGASQGFTAYGIADDDAWVDAAGGRIVIDAKTGRTLYKGWRVFPVYGGSGWTVASTLDVCCETQYLLRSQGTLVAALPTTPTS